VEDDDNEIELNLLREDRTGAGNSSLLRLEPWVNQVQHSSLLLAPSVLLLQIC
jgi:hypothetical protein